MTAKEADEAAKNCQRVMCGGIVYTRISEVGYRYDDKGNRTAYCALYSKKNNSVVVAKPSEVSLFA